MPANIGSGLLLGRGHVGLGTLRALLIGQLAADLSCHLVLAQSLKARMAQAAVLGPLGVGDLADERRLEPHRILALCRRHLDEGRAVALERLEAPGQHLEIGARKAGADLAGKNEIVALEGAEQERGERPVLGARAAVAADHELGALSAFDLEPVLGATGHVRRGRALRQDAFEPRRAGLAVERLAHRPRHGRHRRASRAAPSRPSASRAAPSALSAARAANPCRRETADRTGNSGTTGAACRCAPAAI